MDFGLNKEILIEFAFSENKLISMLSVCRIIFKSSESFSMSSTGNFFTSANSTWPLRKSRATLPVILEPNPCLTSGKFISFKLPKFSSSHLVFWGFFLKFEYDPAQFLFK